MKDGGDRAVLLGQEVRVVGLWATASLGGICGGAAVVNALQGDEHPKESWD